MFPRLVDRRVAGGFTAASDVDGALNFFPANPAQTLFQRFAVAESIAHLDLFTREFHVAIAFLARDFTPKPSWRLKFTAGRVTGEFHFGNDQTAIASVIDIDLDHNIFPRQRITHLAQPPACRRRPKGGELFRAQPDFALFAAGAAANLEGEG